jgi:hypothetical protein
MTARRTIELIVSLRVPDVVASTAFHALKERLDFGDTLHDLRRHDFHRFSMEDVDDDRAEKLTRALIEKTTTFVNPNKHSYSIRLDDRCLIPRKPDPEVPDGVRKVAVLITPIENGDEDNSIEFLRRKLDEPAVVSVSSGVLWDLFIKADSDADAERIALDIAVARRRTEGLLLNPHYQKCEII